MAIDFRYEPQDQNVSEAETSSTTKPEEAETSPTIKSEKVKKPRKVKAK